jgi:hypothetical protein
MGNKLRRRTGTARRLVRMLPADHDEGIALLVFVRALRQDDEGLLSSRNEIDSYFSSEQ